MKWIKLTLTQRHKAKHSSHHAARDWLRQLTAREEEEEKTTKKKKKKERFAVCLNPFTAMISFENDQYKREI